MTMPQEFREQYLLDQMIQIFSLLFCQHGHRLFASKQIEEGKACQKMPKMIMRHNMQMRMCFSTMDYSGQMPSMLLLVEQSDSVCQSPIQIESATKDLSI